MNAVILLCVFPRKGKAITHEGNLSRYCNFITNAVLAENCRQRGVLGN